MYKLCLSRQSLARQFREMKDFCYFGGRAATEASRVSGQAQQHALLKSLEPFEMGNIRADDLASGRRFMGGGAGGDKEQ